jgi:hypothetical protein
MRKKKRKKKRKKMMMRMMKMMKMIKREKKMMMMKRRKIQNGTGCYPVRSMLRPAVPAIAGWFRCLSCEVRGALK